MKEQSLPELRILKIEMCQSLSGRTSITYHVGCTVDGEIYIRIWTTGGKGVYSKEWVQVSEIEEVLGKHLSISAPLLLPLFKAGRSVNTAGFLLAVLKNEGLVGPSQEKAHRYVPADGANFVASVTQLASSGAALDPDTDTVGVVRGNRKTKNRAAPGCPPWQSSPQS